ncbi:MAG: hypothetical protein A4E38_00403 [Methanoregulaceae archaeon PtaB.Bin108]|nr:MAG: hypothetical protein A4E38_00403 [Methanoregulaceae archaeon PtaB.Bin108]
MPAGILYAEERTRNIRPVLRSGRASLDHARRTRDEAALQVRQKVVQRRLTDRKRTGRNIMDAKDGRFVNGEWIENNTAPEDEGGKRPQGVPIDQRITQVSALVNTSFHQVLALARDLVTTPEGHAHIEKQIQQASSEIENALTEILKSGEEILKSGEEKKEGTPDYQKKEIKIE